MTNFERYEKTSQAVFLALSECGPVQDYWRTNQVRPDCQTFILRGLSRLLPLRQNVFRDAIAPWLENAQQALQSPGMPVSQLLKNVTYPFPCRVDIQGNFLPCWVWGESKHLLVISIIEPRTGQFGSPRNVPAERLVDRHRWFDAQVIDGEQDCISAGQTHFHQFVQPDMKSDEPSVIDAIRHPNRRTLNPILSVTLIAMIVVVFTWVVTSHLGF
ncbi:hypothetical protein Q4491_20255 [Photobacterium sp. 2_MG-2023]|uniref:hypothetical protein n=1 Tax=Photobacterium sp. 2_MG-2023 TaxID=3062663 RepID=UPI0026E2E356|nr:hypothetical protein [Photobacterium sp. 2_MG-2023]MDO6583679.1 hypothetical protein [Photobacterium sp. 2_MG-2023]